MKRGESGGISISRLAGVVLKLRTRLLVVVDEGRRVVVLDSERQGAAGIEGGMVAVGVKSVSLGKDLLLPTCPPRSD